MASAQVTSWNQSGGILTPGSAGGAAGAALRARLRERASAAVGALARP